MMAPAARHELRVARDSAPLFKNCGELWADLSLPNFRLPRPRSLSLSAAAGRGPRAERHLLAAPIPFW